MTLYHPDTGQRVELWKVTVERTAELDVYVLAATREQAETDAHEIASTEHWESVADSDMVVGTFPRVIDLAALPPGEDVWSGGEDGRDLRRDEIPTEPLPDKPPAPLVLPGQEPLL